MMSMSCRGRKPRSMSRSLSFPRMSVGERGSATRAATLRARGGSRAKVRWWGLVPRYSRILSCERPPSQ